MGLSGGLNSYVYANHEPWRYVDVLGLVTLQEARGRLAKEGVAKKGERVIGRGSYNIGEIRLQCYSDEQVFNKWLEMERSNTAWLKELNDRKCPATLDEVRANPSMWGDALKVHSSIAFAWYFHRGSVWDVRSKPTKGGHTNQCTYDINRNLIRFQRPAAGTADYKECRKPIVDCKEHKEHDVDPYSLAVKLGRMDDYYSVRPTLY